MHIPKPFSARLNKQGAILVAALALFVFHTTADAQLTADTCLPPATPSVIDIPIKASLTKLFEEIEKADKKGGENDVFAGDVCVSNPIWKDCYGTFYSYKWHRDAFSPSLVGNTLTLSLGIHYGIKGVVNGPVGGIGGSCGWDEDEKFASSKVHTTLSWNDDYVFSPNTSIDPFDTDCKVTLLNINVSGLVAGQLNKRLDFAKEKINSVVAGFNFKPVAERVWANMQTTVRLGTTDQWLVISPVGLSASPLNGSGNEVSTGIGLSAMIQVTRSKTKPDVGPPISLPKLGGSIQPSGLKLFLEGSVSFRDASAKLRSSLIGKQYQTALGPAKIRDAAASGNGKQIVLTIKTEGALNATIQGDGQLIYDPDTKSMQVTGLVFSGHSPDEQTQQIIDALKNDPGFISSVQAGAVWPLGAQLVELKSNLTAALNRDLGDNLSISGQINELQPGQVYAFPTSSSSRSGPDDLGGEGLFRLTLTVDGTAKIRIN
jgi:hypothetical protein